MKGKEDFHLQSQLSFPEFGLVHVLSGLLNRSHFTTFTKKDTDFGADQARASQVKGLSVSHLRNPSGPAVG